MAGQEDFLDELSAKVRPKGRWKSSKNGTEGNFHTGRGESGLSYTKMVKLVHQGNSKLFSMAVMYVCCRWREGNRENEYKNDKVARDQAGRRTARAR